ncbi:MAG: glycosyltransferase family 2 protein [Planctomycetes bacterium]|nr:glycosyltransferase family 2 protein [Planctomycetota bacterium]
MLATLRENVREETAVHEPTLVEEPAPEFSVVMPCLNEAKTVGRCVAKARACLELLGVSFEIVVADNGSNDGSQAVAAAYGARVVSVERKGYGSALQGGIAAARGAYVIMGDADDSYDFSNLEPFITELRQGDELVMGNRFKGGIRPGAMPLLHRYVGNPVLSGILNLFFHTPVGDAHCGLRGFRKESYERLGLTTTGMEFASEMVVKASLYKQRISEVPTTLSPDGRDRPPHLRSFRDGWRHLRFLLLMCPLWLYLIPAAALLSGGLVCLLWPGLGPQMYVGSLCMLAGIQLLWLWAFAQAHGWQRGLFPLNPFTRGVLRGFTLERGLLGGGVVTLAGLAATFSTFGRLDAEAALRVGLWGFLLFVLGVQTIFGSFFLNMLAMNDRHHNRG